MKVVSTVDPDVDVSPEQGEALVRIAAEAVRNAVRHGGARQIDLALTAEPLCLSITDDGEGFATGQQDVGRTGGFGLISMRERARTIGMGELVISSVPGEGTTIRATRQ